MTIKRINLDETTIDIEGYFFKYIKGDGVYLSSSNSFFNLCTVDLYSDIRLVSSYNPPFNGTPYTNYTLEDENRLLIKLDNTLPTGNYDIIFCNPAGYIKSSKEPNNFILEVVE